MINFLKRNKKTILFLLAIVFLSAGLRLYKLGEKSLVADEFLGVNTSYGFLQTGEWHRWDFNLGKIYQDKSYFKTWFDFDFWRGGEQTYTRAWLYNWQTAQSLKILPSNKESSYRLAGVFWGILTTLIIYFVSLKLTGRKTIGLLSAFLWAISIDSIEFSRKIRMYTMFTPIFLLFAYSAFSFLEYPRKIGSKFCRRVKEKTGFNLPFLIPTIFLGLLSMHLHLLTGNIVFIFLIYFLVMGLIVYRTEKRIINRYFVYLSLILLAGILLVGKNNFFASSLGWQNHFTYLEKSFADYTGIILAIFLLAVGAWYLFKKGEIKESVFLLSSYFVVLLSAIFLWNRNVGTQYLFFIKPFQIILLSVGIYGLANFLRDNSKQFGGKIFAITLISLLLIVPNYAYFWQEENTYTQTARSGNPNYRKIFDYVIKKKNTDDVLITRNFRNFYWAGQRMTVYSLGGERADKLEKKLTLNRLQEIIKKHSSGWLVFSDNDESFISKEAQLYIENNLEKISNSQVRGPISVYRWGSD